MSFTVPSFNLMCKIWTNGAPPPAPARVTSPCNLAWGKRVQAGQGVGTFLFMQLLLPAGTDIRNAQTATGLDWVEVPAGTGRFYRVVAVDDAGKGFVNEHRIAVITAVANFGNWPTPIP